MDDMVEILDDILKRPILHMPPRGAFMDIIKDAESRIDRPEGQFGIKRKH